MILKKTLMRILFALGSVGLYSSNTIAQPICASLFSHSQNDTFRVNSPKAFIQNIGAMFSEKIPNQIIYENSILSPPQLKALVRFSNNTNKPIKNGDVIKVMKIADMQSEVQTSVGKQYIGKNGQFEVRLLNASGIDINPKEVLSFRIHYISGHTAEVPFMVKGDINSVNFDQGSSQLFDFLQGDSSGIKIIEIAHTHPTYAVSVKSVDGSSKFRANELSLGDMQAAMDFAKRFPTGMTIVMKAILPNGFNYISIIPSGH